MAEAGGIQPATDDDQSDVDALCVRTLFERIYFVNALAPLGTLFLGWYEKDSVSLSSLAGWLFLMTLLQTVTLWNSKRLLRQPVPKETLRYWYNFQLYLSGLEGMCWGSAVIFFHSIGGAGQTNNLTVLTVIITVVCISIFALAPSYQIFISFISGALLIPVAHYFWVGDMNRPAYVIGILTLLLALIRLGRVANLEFVEGVRRLVLIQSISMQLEQRNQQLDKLNRKINDIAIHDKLTGLYNRHFIVDQLEMQYGAYVRYGNACSIVMIDIDHFKQVNDRYGHIVGDKVLVAFSRRVEIMVRQGDLIGRYGGEEFLLVLPMTGLAAALQLAERIRISLTDQSLVEQPAMHVVTASFGVAEIRSGESIDDWLLRSDQALYSAKEHGRNCVMEWMS